MRTAILILAAAILACAGIFLGFYLGTQSAVREAASTLAQSVGSAADSATALSSVSDTALSCVSSTSSEVISEEESPDDAAVSSESASSADSTSSGGTEPSDGTESSVEKADTTPELNGRIVCIDPGHQDHGMSETEPNGPGSSVMKAKLTSGTSGSASGKDEYEVNLEVSLRLRDELEKRGYTVVMTRETNDVEISNAERAQIASAAGADIFIRIHCNSSSDSSVRGVLAYVPTAGNPFLSADVIERSRRLGQILVDSQCAVTGQESRGLLEGDDMTGINWATMPVTIIEMGFMSNPDEDLFLASQEGQNLIMIGLANGVDSYFAS